MMDLRVALCNCLSPHHEVRVPAESRLLDLSCERGYALHLMHLIISEVSTSIAPDLSPCSWKCSRVNKNMLDNELCVLQHMYMCMCDRTCICVTGKKASAKVPQFSAFS